MKRHKYSMDINTANDILQNVFAAGEQAPNTIPFDKIVLRGMAQTTLVNTCKWIAVVFLGLTLLSPLAFRTSFEIEDLHASKSIEVVEHKLYRDAFVMLLHGELTDYENIYCKKKDGTVVFPTHIEFVNGDVQVTIPYDGDELNIFIPDMSGNVMQAILSER